jgi:hypothetical protein
MPITSLTPAQRDASRQARHDRHNQKAAAAATVEALLAKAGG